jgi:hypothetical protein
MWATMALTAALSFPLAQTGSLKLKNVRPVQWTLGYARPNAQVLPGDLYVVAFDITGLKVRDDGLVRYSLGLDLLNAEGKSQFKSDPGGLEVVNTLGGDSLPAFARAVVGTDTPPGQYTMKVTVKDLSAETEETLVHKFEILRPQFGFVRVGLAYETKFPAPPIAVTGQKLLLHWGTAHFDVDKKTGEADVDVQLRIIDEATGKPTLPRASTVKIKRLPAGFAGVLLQEAPIELNRTGKFTIVLTAKDNLSGKSIEQRLPITVQEVK